MLQGDFERERMDSVDRYSWLATGGGFFDAELSISCLPKTLCGWNGGDENILIRSNVKVDAMPYEH